MNDAVLTLNAGSSSVKFALFANDGLRLLAKGEIEESDSTALFTAQDAQGKTLATKTWPKTPTFDALIEDVIGWAGAQLGKDKLLAVGHRVVHGGPDHAAPERVTAGLLEALDALVPLAPLHLPHNIALIRAVARAKPGL